MSDAHQQLISKTVQCSVDVKLAQASSGTSAVELADLQAALHLKEAEMNADRDASSAAAKEAHVINLGLGTLSMHAPQGMRTASGAEVNSDVYQSKCLSTSACMGLSYPKCRAQLIKQVGGHATSNSVQAHNVHFEKRADMVTPMHLLSAGVS